MALKVDFSIFLNEKGDVTNLTDQANTVFAFLSKIVSSVSADISKSIINVDLKCNTRSDALSCDGSIDGAFNQTGIIEWNCDTCEAIGEISYWQGSLWDKQKHMIH
jgi:hypothetical protein